MYSPGLKQKAPTTRELNEEANQVSPKIMEFMKKIVIAEDCEFYKALTYEHWTKLYKFWISTQVECEGERKWMHQHFSLSRENIMLAIVKQEAETDTRPLSFKTE